MTCPNAPTAPVTCDGRRWVMHRSQPIPCPGCWDAAGRPPITARQRTALRRWHVLLTIVTADALLVTDEDATAFDHACNQLRRLDVDDDLRNAWQDWLRREGAPPIEVAA